MNAMEYSPAAPSEWTSARAGRPLVADQNAAELSIMLRLWRILVRRRWLILGSMVVVMLLG
ncbi:MAG: hypothetical protein EON59_15900, partial [Alphaproteobacteria bacterium]